VCREVIETDKFHLLDVILLSLPLNDLHYHARSCGQDCDHKFWIDGPRM